MSENHRLIAIEIDDATLSATGADAAHERRVAIFDILEKNEFRLVHKSSDAPGPFRLLLSSKDGKLVFDIQAEDETPLHTFILSLSPFRGVIRDYAMICESYFDAIRSGAPHQIEAIDMARRGIHNEGSELLGDRLAGKVEVDFDTARRLFTLICALRAGSTRAPSMR